MTELFLRIVCGGGRGEIRYKKKEVKRFSIILPNIVASYQKNACKGAYTWYSYSALDDIVSCMNRKGFDRLTQPLYGCAGCKRVWL